MLIEDVALLSYDLDYGWISLILMIFSSLLVILVFIILVDLRIYILHHGLFLTTLVIGNRGDFIDINDHIICSKFYVNFWSTLLIGDLEGGYIDDFEDLSWLYIIT